MRSAATGKTKASGRGHNGGREFATRLDLPAEKRTKLEGLLNARLADALDLYAQTKQAHWNVKGNDFYQLHLLFDSLAETIEEHADLFAERVTALGGTARGTVRMSAEASSLPEFPEDLLAGRAFVEALADHYGAYGNNLRSAIEQAEELATRAPRTCSPRRCARPTRPSTSWKPTCGARPTTRRERGLGPVRPNP